MSPATCSQCGTKIDAGARFCMRCGADVSGIQGHVATEQVPTDPPSTRAFRRSLLEQLRHATLGDYEILVEAGSGGMATVFLAHDIQLDRKVAIKVMSPTLLEGEGMVERFKLEARTAASLSHPHIIPIYAVKETDNLLYFVMKFVDGRPLDSIIKQIGPLPIPMVQTVLSRVAEALGYAHRHGVVHRDIKPANVMIDIEGLPVVTDFGIAKVADTQGLTMTGATIGTPTYMSPEQCVAGEITGASDQYSLGVVAFEMLTGRPPFDSESAMTIMYKHCHEEPASLLELRRDCPPTLAAAVMRMLAKEPADRWPRMEAAIADIGAPNLSFDHPVRTQMIDLAREGANRELLRRVSTPRSPMPLGKPAARTVPDASTDPEAATVKLVSAPRTSLADARAPAPPARKKRTGLWVGGTLGLAAIGTTVAVLAPWRPAPGDQAPPNPVDPVADSPAAPLATVARIEVSPAQQSISIGGAAQLVANAADSLGGAVAVAEPVTWVSDRPSVASVSAEGLVTALAAGRALITARIGSVTAGAEIVVEPPPSVAGPSPTRPAPVASVVIASAPATLEVGATARLAATMRDRQNGILTGRSLTWRSGDPDVASVDARTGQVTARSPGRVTITATSEGISRSVALEVLPEPVTRVTISPSAVGPLLPGESAQLSAAGVGRSGAGLTGRAVRWSTSDPHVATVSTTGLLQAVGPGSAVIGAAIEGQSADLSVRVEAPVQQAPPIPEPPASNPRQEIDDVVQLYARALEAHDLAAVRRVFPGITSQQESQLGSSFQIMRDLKVTLRVGDVRLAGNVAEIVVSGTYDFYNTASRRQENTAVTFQMTLQRGAAGWLITETR